MVWTDLFQGVVLVAGIIIMVVAVSCTNKPKYEYYTAFLVKMFIRDSHTMLRTQKIPFNETVFATE